MKDKRFPPGWDEARVHKVLAHSKNQTDDEQFAEIEAALNGKGITLTAAPTELVPEVRALLGRSESS
jgi:hypothetical protein